MIGLIWTLFLLRKILFATSVNNFEQVIDNNSINFNVNSQLGQIRSLLSIEISSKVLLLLDQSTYAVTRGVVFISTCMCSC